MCLHYDYALTASVGLYTILYKYIYYSYDFCSKSAGLCYYGFIVKGNLDLTFKTKPLSSIQSIFSYITSESLFFFLKNSITNHFIHPDMHNTVSGIIPSTYLSFPSALFPQVLYSLHFTLLNTALCCDASVLVKGSTMISFRFLHLPLILSAFSVRTYTDVLPTFSSPQIPADFSEMSVYHLNNLTDKNQILKVFQVKTSSPA